MHTSVIFATLNGLFFFLLSFLTFDEFALKKPTACLSLFTNRGLLLNGPQCSGNKGLKIHGIMMFSVGVPQGFPICLFSIFKKERET